MRDRDLWDVWKSWLTNFDFALLGMCRALTGKECEPKYGRSHYFFEVDYGGEPDPDFVVAIMDAIEGRAGKRLLSIEDDAERHALLVRIKFDEDYSVDNRFVPEVWDMDL